MSESAINVGRARLRQAGFTAFEMMITVAIVAILAGIALPNYREFSIRQTVVANVNGLIGGLNMARSEAVKRGRRVALIANGGNWAAGWQVVVGELDGSGRVADPSSPGSDEASCASYVDGGGVPMCPRYDGAIPTGYSILSAADGGDDAQVVFGVTGALVGATQFDFSVCRPSENPDPEQSRRIHVESSGIISSYRGTADSPAGTCG